MAKIIISKPIPTRFFTVQRIGANMTEIRYSDGSKALMSYETRVAYVTAAGLFYRTEKKWSTTTQRHISKWMAGLGYPAVMEKPQAFFDEL